MSNIRLKLPPTFYDDHVSRDLPAGIEIKRTKTYVLVEADDEERKELRSDARHYVTPGLYASDYPGLVSSARATLRALDKAEECPQREQREWHEYTQGTLTPDEMASLASAINADPSGSTSKENS